MASGNNDKKCLELFDSWCLPVSSVFQWCWNACKDVMMSPHYNIPVGNTLSWWIGVRSLYQIPFNQNNTVVGWWKSQERVLSFQHDIRNNPDVYINIKSHQFLLHTWMKRNTGLIFTRVYFTPLLNPWLWNVIQTASTLGSYRSNLSLRCQIIKRGPLRLIRSPNRSLRSLLPHQRAWGAMMRFLWLCSPWRLL